MSTTVELVAIWSAIASYAAATVAFTVSAVLGREKWERTAIVATIVGAATQLVALAARWVATGHGPVMGFVELAPLATLFAVAALLLLVWRHPGLALGGVGLTPIALLTVGASLLADRTAQPLGPNLASMWLVIHVVFANLAYALYSAAFVLGVAHLLKDGHHSGRLLSLLARFPEPAELDSLTYRVVGAGFVFQTVMIVSGAIWANEAWGRYWGWDPIETWSLIAWVTYALYLHLMLTFGWRGRRAAWLGIASLAIIVFALFGVPFVYHSIHGAYFAL